MSYSVRLSNVTKRYKMHRQNSDKLKDLIYPNGYGEDFYALRNIDLLVEPGDVVGLVGINGSGKSTISNIIGGITPPTMGEVDVKGEVAVIAVAAGLNKDLTGRENIELKCLMMGYKKSEIEKMKPDIIEFADIGKFIDMPVKKYSSGMKARLGFSISISVDPDVLIIDEALSVGDKTFADKCLEKMNEFKARGKTIFFVSHSAGQMKKFCNKALWLEHGEVREYGTMKDVMPRFEAFVKDFNQLSKEKKKAFKEEGIRKQANLVAPPHQDDSSLVPSLSRSKGNKKKISSKKGKLGIFALIMASFITIGYFQKDVLIDVTSQVLSFEEKDEAVMANTKVQKESKEKQNKKNPLEEIDVRYVEVARARVRSAPTLKSTEVTLLDFAHPFKVIDVKNGDTTWSSTTTEDGDEVWLSNNISKKISLSKAFDYNEFLQRLEGLTDTTELKRNAKYLGQDFDDLEGEYEENKFSKTVEDMEGISYSSSSVDLVVNGNDQVSKVNIHHFSFPITKLIEEFGTAHLNDEYSSLYLYRTNKYDFFFQSNDGVRISDIKIVSLLDL